MNFSNQIFKYKKTMKLKVILTILLGFFATSSMRGNMSKDNPNENLGRLSNVMQVSEKWQSLFNGASLEGWKIIGGKKNFKVEDGMIVGTVKKDPGENYMENFLVTEKDYSDFILELEFKIDKGMNSGVQIRSSTYKHDTVTTYTSGKLEVSRHKWEAGAVHGYQVEIDPSPRAWSGGLYEQGGRGWLQNLLDNPDAQKAFISEGWNQYKIKVQGNRIKTWINGVSVVDFTDDLSKKGFIGLQVEGDINGKKVRFRNIRIKEL